MECKLVRTVDLPKHDVFFGEIVTTYCDNTLMKDNVIEIGKVNPILFVMNDRSYWKLGEKLADAWKIGKQLKHK
jgi:flavin reductase (DIM6/NTAB) family NADH-FMN oxidoreductase RutF